MQGKENKTQVFQRQLGIEIKSNFEETGESETKLFKSFIFVMIGMENSK